MGQQESMSDCDKLKLRKMYKCDIGEYANECLDYNSSLCNSYERDGSCKKPFAQENCKNTCKNCNKCMDNFSREKCKKMENNGRCCEKDVMKNCMKTCNLCDIL